MLLDLVAHEGYAPLVAAGGEEALALAARYPLDLALVDVVMPDMDGLELLARLRIQFPDLPVILLTAHATLERAVEGFRQGAADFAQAGRDESAVSGHRAGAGCRARATGVAGERPDPQSGRPASLAGRRGDSPDQAGV